MIKKPLALPRTLQTADLSQYSRYRNPNDWAPVFDKAFDDLVKRGGGVLTIPPGQFYTKSMVTIPTGVNVRGAGAGATILRLYRGMDCDIVSFDVNRSCGISNLTIYGNAGESDPANNRDGLVLGRPGLSAELNDGTMPYLTIHDVTIRSVSGNGFRCYPNTWVYFLSRIRIEFCTGHGALVESTDNMYDTFYIHNNGKHGLHVTGSNNRFSNMKIIFNGRENLGDDIDMAGVYSEGRRNTFVNIEAQENYGHGFVFNSCIDTDLAGLLSDANGYAMIANGLSERTASGFYFTRCQRFSGDIKATNFKTNVSQKSGVVIDSTCENIALDYENDGKGEADSIGSVTSILTRSLDKVDLYADVQKPLLLSSGTVLDNKITGIDSHNFGLYPTRISDYTVSGSEIRVITNWGGTPRLQLENKSVIRGRTYLIKMMLKSESPDYYIRLSILYNDGSPDYSIRIYDGRYGPEYREVCVAFTADRDSEVSFYLTDVLGNENPDQHPFYAKNMSFIDITDILSQGYALRTVQKALDEGYFFGEHRYTKPSQELRRVSVSEYLKYPNNLAAGTAEGWTGRTKHVTHGDVSTLTLVYSNTYAQSSTQKDTEGPAAVTLKVSIEKETGEKLPFRVNGQKQFTILPGQILKTEPLGVSLSDGEVFYLNTFIQVPNDGDQFPYGYNADWRYDGDGTETTVTWSNSANNIMLPNLILGVSSQPSILVPGDSISAGTGDSGLTESGRTLTGNMGWAVRAFMNRVAWVNVSRGGQDVSEYLEDQYVWMRRNFMMNCTHAIVLLGTNDLGKGDDFETIQNNLLKFWGSLNSLGMKVIAGTIPPISSSVDGWATEQGQTPSSSTEVRNQVNDWIRTTPAPLTGYIDFADVLEPSRNAGIWKPGLTSDGTHPNATGHQAMADEVDIYKFT